MDLIWFARSGYVDTESRNVRSTGNRLRRSTGWTFGAVIITVLIIALVSARFGWAGALFGQRHGLAQTTAVAESTGTESPTTPRPSPATPVATAISSVATPTPAATPTTQSAKPSWPQATLTLQSGMIPEPNGVSIGCGSGLIGQYLTCTAREPSGDSLTFYLYVPVNFSTATKYPLVLVLQGGGERANAKNPAWLNRVGAIGGPYAEEFGPGYASPYAISVQARWPSFVVIPQLVNPARFVDVSAGQGSYKLAPQPNTSMRMTKEIVDALQYAYPNIDANRLYLTGLSMGGYGAWEAAERWPDYWAAVAPIAGAGDPSLAYRLVNVPIWAFHSTNDPVVPVSGSRDMIAAIRTAGGHPRYTEYPTGGHDEWLKVYTVWNQPSPTVDFFSWLFAQHK